MATDEIVIQSEDLDNAAKALGNVETRQLVLDALEQTADIIQKIGEVNLKNREGGGKYTRAVASVETVESSDGWGVELDTPWFGMEFGGHVTNVYGNKIGSSRSAAIGLEPMWAPWHQDFAQGYIIGAAWTESQGDVEEFVTNAVEKGIDVELDKEGVPRG